VFFVTPGCTARKLFLRKGYSDFDVFGL
jgi:hypothetical protein